jgi:hypothetical protein
MTKRTGSRMRLVEVPKRGGRDSGVRWSRVEGARARIASGYYDRDDVRERLLDVLLDELGH